MSWNVFFVLMCSRSGISLDNTVADGTGSITLDDVACTGNELSLFDCVHASYFSHNCNHSEDFGVRCSAYYLCEKNYYIILCR